MEDSDDKSFHIPINGSLDLHMFAPKDAIDVVDEYIKACLEKGIYEVRIIHGKGKGVLRRQIHTFLKSHPMVAAFRLDSGPSGWGASIACLKKNLHVSGMINQGQDEQGHT